MTVRLLVLVLVALPMFLTGCATPEPAASLWPAVPQGRKADFPENDLASTEITLRRGSCYGPCPIYGVTIRGTGKVSWSGHRYVAFAGSIDYRVAPEEVAALVEQFRAADFFSLADKYEANITDSPTYEVSIKIGDAVKTVTDYIGQSVGMPATVTAIEAAIDRVIKVERWIGGTDETMPMLRAANWDFRSRHAADVLACSAAGAPGWLVSEMLAAGVPTDGTCDEHSAVENAAYAAHAGAFKVLVEAGGAAGASQRSRNDFLISGIIWCEPELVATALTLKPDLEVSSEPDFIPPLGLALGACEPDDKDKTIQILRLLIAAGIDLNRRFADGGTIAFDRSDATSVKILVALGADINLRNTFGRTPLLSAKSEEAALALIEAGADTTARANSGQSVLDYARGNQWSKVVQILEQQP